MSKSCVILRHVYFEDLGAFEVLLREAGYVIRYIEAGHDRLPDRLSCNLLVILGGPIGAYEDDLYPFLKKELALITAQLAASKPVLGICLGAQLIARALGARVYPGRAKEIGWKPLRLTEAGEKLLSPLKRLPVLHWHGDTFDLPPGAINLASTDICDHQAFAVGDTVLAFQFHPEAQEPGFERWLIGHACEIAATPNVSVTALREDAAHFAAASAQAGQSVLRAWLHGLS
jgi:GMP synthase (glutamine-hydrolysing)